MRQNVNTYPVFWRCVSWRYVGEWRHG